MQSTFHLTVLGPTMAKFNVNSIASNLDIDVQSHILQLTDHMADLSTLTCATKMGLDIRGTLLGWHCC